MCFTLCLRGSVIGYRKAPWLPTRSGQCQSLSDRLGPRCWTIRPPLIRADQTGINTRGGRDHLQAVERPFDLLPATKPSRAELPPMLVLAGFRMRLQGIARAGIVEWVIRGKRPLILSRIDAAQFRVRSGLARERATGHERRR